ncbi:sugar phosphate isomerase/epimerase family protein [Planctomycetota bacterium]
MNINEQLAVQSYCFRNFKDNQKVVELVKECGLSAIELCGVHADFNDENTFDDLLKVYADGGVGIVSIGVEGFSNDEAAERKRFDFSKKAGLKVISCDFRVNTVPDSYRTAEKLADEYDINVAIHNHGGRHWLGAAQMLDQVFADTSPRIGLCLDTAWAMHSHEDPVTLTERFKDRLYSLHLKDFVFDRAGNPEDVVVGTGNLDLAAVLDLLDKQGFSGPAVIEYEGDVEDPAPAVAKCVEAIKAI